MTNLPSLKIYRISNRITGHTQTIVADSAQEACNNLRWLIGNCHVRVLLDPNDYDHPLFRDFHKEN